MGINPVQVVAVGAETPRSGSRPSHAPDPNLQAHPKVERDETVATLSPTAIRQTEVRVHSDTSTGQSVLIHQFVDSRSGSLVFQVPSEQILGLMQAIQRQLERLSPNTPGKVE